MTAKIICLACRVIERDPHPDPWWRYGWALQCVCGGVAPEEYRRLRVDMYAIDELLKSKPSI